VQFSQNDSPKSISGAIGNLSLGYTETRDTMENNFLLHKL
jgi:hypothetical protein